MPAEPAKVTACANDGETATNAIAKTMFFISRFPKNSANNTLDRAAIKTLDTLTVNRTLICPDPVAVMELRKPRS